MNKLTVLLLVIIGFIVGLLVSNLFNETPIDNSYVKALEDKNATILNTIEKRDIVIDNQKKIIDSLEEKI